MNCELENPYILLYDGKLSSMNDILHLLEAIQMKIDLSLLLQMM